tara:strand:+ start:2943 stop:3740 length:798 start_codon:yes stop_codon:yes gene_type:complete
MIEILMFHRVLPKVKINTSDAYFIRGTLISQERFESVILDYLKQDYSFKTISALDYNSDIKQVALTFDDGYTDNYLFVKPILEKYRIRATFYPIIGYCKERKVAPLDYYYQYVNENIAIDQKEKWITGKQKKLFLAFSITQQKDFVKKLNMKTSKIQVSYMTLNEIHELNNLGHEIGGHSFYHDIYTRLNSSEILEDIQKTKNTLSKIGINISSYAYTDGQYNSEIIDILKYENIKYSCAIKPKNISSSVTLELSRKFVTENELI